jgi:membrane protein DedA with SNARE-associated domain
MMNFVNTFKKNFDLIFAVIFVSILFFGFRAMWGYFDLPSMAMLVDILQDLFLQYGLIIVFVAAFLESLFLIGNYFPGTLILAFSIATTSHSLYHAVAMSIVIATAMLCGYSLDYLLGKYAGEKMIKKFNLEKEIQSYKVKIEENSIWSFFTLYVLPGFGSLFSVSAGAMKISYSKYMSFLMPTVLFWNVVWVLGGFIFGEQLLTLIKSGYFGYAIIAIFIIYFVASGKYKQFQS